MVGRPTRCAKPGCGGLVKSRGVCNCCYQGYNQMVKRGETTWEQLEAEGKTLPAVGRTAMNNILYREMTAQMK